MNRVLQVIVFIAFVVLMQHAIADEATKATHNRAVNSSDTLELKPRAVIDGDRVLLSDLISNLNHVAEDIKHIDLGNAPHAGKRIQWSPQRVARVLKDQAGITGVTFTGAQHCIISRASRPLDTSEIELAIITVLKMSTRHEGVSRVLEVVPPRSWQVPLGPIQIEASPEAGTLQKPWSNALVRVVLHGKEQSAKQVRFHWSWNRSVWSSASAIKKDALLRPQYFTKTPVDILKQTRAPWLGEIPLDSTAKRNLRPGAILTASDIKPREVISRGNAVSVLYQQGTVSIELTGIALDSGAKGETITVQNPVSRKKFPARILQEGKVLYVH